MRIVLVIVAGFGLWLAGIADERFDAVAVQAQRFDLRLYLATITPLALAGACATAAVRHPWRAASFGWRVLWFVPLFLLPAVHVALLRWAPQLGWEDPGWLFTYRWFDGATVVAVAAALAGAAIGCGPGAGRGDAG